MSQQGQVLRLKRRSRDGEPLWAYRYRAGGRDSKRVQRGGFASERDAAEALERELERLRRERRVSRSLTLAELVEVYLAQHDVEPVTIEKLRWLLGKAVAVFGERPVGELRSEEVAAWRIALSPGYRFDATQALRQVLARAVVWGMIDVNPAKLGVDNPSPRRREQRSFTKGRLKCPKTEASRRAVPLQTIAVEALEQQRAGRQGALVFPAERGGYLDIHHFRPFQWRPAQRAAGIDPVRRVYDLRHTFATFALRAGISTFDLSRYMGASLTMIDRHYGHLARDGREYAIKLLDALYAPWTLVDARWTPEQKNGVTLDNNSPEIAG